MGFENDRAVARPLRTLWHLGAVGTITDGQLLERFTTGRDETAELAFAALVERHGPMVLRVCRGVLDDPHATQDAFQATFLVLVRKARGLWVRDSLGPWLHQVAFRTASCARIAAARRKKHERRAAEARSDRIERIGPGWEFELHAEIDRLPERFREPIVLCDLEGRSHEQAARHLGWPVGTVKSRQARGRERLRLRLVRRGLAPAVGLIAAETRAEVPLTLVRATVSASLNTITVRVFTSGSAALHAKEVLRAMSMTQCGKVVSMLVALSATASIPVLGPWLAFGNAPKASAPQVDRAAAVPVKPGKPTEEPKPVEGVLQGSIAVPVVPGKLRAKLVERGVVEASQSEDAYSNVEGQTTIIKIVSEGTKVAKGDLVCELDSSSLKDQLTNQRITTSQAEANYQNAQLTREVAEIALTEYVEGIFKQENAALLGEMVTAEATIKRVEKRLERTRLARKELSEAIRPRGNAVRTPADILAEVDLDDRLEAAELSLGREKRTLEQANVRREILNRYTKGKTIKELTSEIEKARALELSKKAVWDLGKSKEEKLNRMIANCRIYAASAGTVVHANDPNRLRGSNWIVVEEGAMVRERQKIFSIPNLDALVINAHVHEALVDRISPGQRVVVKIDAIPNLDLNGVVEAVAPRPDPTSYLNNNVKVYPTRVKLESVPPGLRPGMSARAEIVYAERDGVLCVPVASVVRYDGEDHVAVVKPGADVEWRVVVLGVSDEDQVEVTEGLRAGELVSPDPLSLMSDSEKRARSPGRMGQTPAAPHKGNDARIESKSATKGGRR